MGIGHATAILLARRGAILSLADKNADGLAATLAELAPPDSHDTQHTVTVLDVRSAGDVNDWITDTLNTFGNLDGAANIAAVHREGGRDLRNSPVWDFVMNINARGVFNCMRAELNALGQGGSLVNMTSLAGLIGSGTSSIYAASKHAVVGLTRSAARSEGERGIRVNCIAPGESVRRSETGLTHGLQVRSIHQG